MDFSRFFRRQLSFSHGEALNFCSESGKTRKGAGVVPANAGTHNHWCLWQKMADAAAPIERARRLSSRRSQR
jgi:hypothetical protein